MRYFLLVVLLFASGHVLHGQDNRRFNGGTQEWRFTERACPDARRLRVAFAHSEEYDFVVCSSAAAIRDLPKDTRAVRLEMDTETGLSELKTLKKVEALSLLVVTPKLIDVVVSFKKLKYLQLHLYGKLELKHFETLAKLRSLVELHLGNHVSAYTFRDAAHANAIFGLKKLEHLTIGNSAHDETISGISKCKKLRSVEFGRATIKASDNLKDVSPTMRAVCGLSKLESLSVILDPRRETDGKLLVEFISDKAKLKRLKLYGVTESIGPIKSRSIEQLSLYDDVRTPWELPALEVFIGHIHAKWAPTFKECAKLRSFFVMRELGDGESVFQTVNISSLETIYFPQEVRRDTEGVWRCILAPNVRNLGFGIIHRSALASVGRSGNLKVLCANIYSPRGETADNTPWKGGMCAPESGKSLEWVSLRALGYYLNGSMISALAELSSLKYLVIQTDRMITSPKPLKNLTDLSTLFVRALVDINDVNDDRFEKRPFPAEDWSSTVSSLSKLKHLYIATYGANPDPQIFGSVAKLKELRHLELNIPDDIDAKLIASLSTLINLEQLRLEATVELDVSAAKAIASLPKLTQLELSARVQSDKVAAELSGFQSLSELDVAVFGSDATDASILKYLAQISSLSNLHYVSNSVTAEDLEVLRESSLFRLTCGGTSSEDVKNKVKELQRHFSKRFQ